MSSENAKALEFSNKYVDHGNQIISIRARLLLSDPSITILDLQNEDDLIVFHLNHSFGSSDSDNQTENSKNFLKFFESFINFLNYDSTLLLDYLIDDDKNANFLKILLKVVKNRKNMREGSKIFIFVDEFVRGKLVKMGGLLPYDCGALVRRWMK